MALRVLFLGTPEFAVPSLRAVAAAGHQLVGVVTQPDRPRGRGNKVTPSPVKAAAIDLGLPVLQPLRLKDAAVEAELRNLRPDLGIVVAYGKILPSGLLSLPRLGMINVHASLLPRWRGAAPIHRAILAGDRETGVTIMRVILELDAGPMLAILPAPIGTQETSIDLEHRLSTLGAELLAETVGALERGPVTETPQDGARVTYAAKLERHDGHISFAQPAAVIHNAIRGLQPWPLVWVMLNGKRTALLASELETDPGSRFPTLDRGKPTPGVGFAAPGTIIRADAAGIVVATAGGSIRITRIQAEGRPPMAVHDYLNGHPTKSGDRFEPVSSSS